MCVSKREGNGTSETRISIPYRVVRQQQQTKRARLPVPSASCSGHLKIPRCTRRTKQNAARWQEEDRAPRWENKHAKRATGWENHTHHPDHRPASGRSPRALLLRLRLQPPRRIQRQRLRHHYGQVHPTRPQHRQVAAGTGLFGGLLGREDANGGRWMEDTVGGGVYGCCSKCRGWKTGRDGG